MREGLKINAELPSPSIRAGGKRKGQVRQVKGYKMSNNAFMCTMAAQISDEDAVKARNISITAIKFSAEQPSQNYVPSQSLVRSV